ILFGSVNGTFGSAINYNIGAISHLIISADFNNDTYPDIATVNGTTNNVSVKLGSATGFDTTFVNYSVGTYPASLIFSDFNGDGNKDIATANANSNNISVLLGIGNGTFGSTVNYPAGNGMSSIVASDFNGDSFIDLAASNYNTDNISVILGSGNGTFSAQSNFATGTGPVTLSSGDFNGDSKMDIASANNGGNNASVLLNTSFSVTISASSSSVCEGDTIVLNGSGAMTYFWSSGNTTTNITVMPVSTTVYSLSGTNAGGCVNMQSYTVTLNPKPNLLLNTSATNICSGNLSILSASGADIYMWSTMDTIPTINVRPTANTSYTVTGTTLFGCKSSSVTSVFVTPSKTLSGSVTSTLGATNGFLALYRYSSLLSKWDSINVTPYNSTYSFGTVDSALYVIKAIPSIPNEQITYATSSISWKNATIISHGCNTNTTQNINIISLVDIGSGSGTLKGKVTKALGYDQKPGSVFSPSAPGEPIGGIVVKGGKNPGGQMFAQTTTDPITGTYTLTGLPVNVNNESYFILIDIPGLDTNNTYHRVIDLTNNEYSDLDFTVDSMKINPVNAPYVGINDLTAIEHQIKVFPNPASNLLSVQYNLKNSALVKIELFDILGKSVKTLLPSSQQSIDNYKISWNIADLKTGLYFIKININGNESVTKLSVIH
ncbi:MAG: T9SS type A sorting domain-containing protein, partial [Bacteroidia bacterium]|nr:T9SS type A sorting domain-containing protein [Bacteroidia bacterium]